MRIFLLAPFRNAYLLRGLVLWAGLRATLALIGLGVFGGVETAPITRVGILAVVGAAVYLDARRRNEPLFLENLGVSRFWIALAGLPVPVLLETILP